MKRGLAIAAACLGIGVAFGGIVTAAQSLVLDTAPVSTVYEDDGEWDCTRMGNRVCGATNEYGEPIVVFYGMEPTAPQGDLARLLPDTYLRPDGGREFLLDSWQPVDQELADALAEGPQDDATTRRWEDCLSLLGDTSWVACPDGTIEVS
jgi:hypothetical protein